MKSVVAVSTLLAALLASSLLLSAQTPSAKAARPWENLVAHPAGPLDFVPPGWMTKDKPDLAAAIQKAGVKVYTDREYVEKGGEPRALDIYVPQNAGKKMPVIVFFHGSPNAGIKEGWIPALMMLPRGYVVVSANYRLVSYLHQKGLAFPQELYDAKAAIRWVRAHAAEYNIDPDRLGIWGHSWGGYLVDLLGTTDGFKQFEGDEGNAGFSSHVNAVISWSGPGDYVAHYQYDYDGFKKHNPGKDPLNCTSANNVGGPGVATPDKAAEASPKTYVRAGLPPFLIMAGEKDDVVPPATSQQPFADALKKAGNACTYFVVPGGGHGFGGPEVDQHVYDFLDKYVPAQPSAK